MGAGMVRVDRGDGKMLQFQPQDVQAFVKDNPDAKVVGPHVAVDTPTPAEVTASEVVSMPTPGRQSVAKAGDKDSKE